MSEFYDSFGVLVENGDLILSASTSGGRVKIGFALIRKGREPAMHVSLSAANGRPERVTRRIGLLGYNVVVLRKENGSIPQHIGGQA